MNLPDPARSRAVLIGTAHFASMEDLPAVTNNLTRLAQLLRDERVWGLPEEHVVVVPEPKSPGEALEEIHKAASAASDTLLVYYAGHGLLDGGVDLLLALPETDQAKPFTAIKFDDVRRQVQRFHKRSAKVIILDCCYSGRAMPGGMEPEGPAAGHLANRAAVEGSYLLVAAGETKTALAPPGETYTAFTGELIKILEEGIEDAPDLISVEQIYWRMHGELTAKRRPLPHQRARNAGNKIVLSRNRWTGAAPTTPKPITEPAAEPEPLPDAHDLPASPGDLRIEVARLRHQGPPGAAEALLRAVGRLKPDQEVAGILLELGADTPGAPEGADVAAVLEGAAGRPLDEVRGILELLGELDERRIADSLLLKIAQGSPERTVEFVAGLHGLGEDGAELGDRLLRQAVALDAEGHPARIIALVTGLSVRDLPGPADAAIQEAGRRLTGEDAAAVADTLLEAGRDSEAARLYGSAIPAIMDREPEQLASIALHLCRQNLFETAERLVLAAARRSVPAREQAALIRALAGDDALRADCRRVLVAELGRLGDDGIRAIVTELWRQGGDAVALSIAAADGRPVERLIGLVADIRAQGRVRDTFRLLEWAAENRSAEDLTTLTATLPEPRRTALIGRLIDHIPGPPSDVFARFFALAREAGDDRAAAVGRSLAARPDAEFSLVIEQLAAAGEVDLATELLNARPVLGALTGPATDDDGDLDDAPPEWSVDHTEAERRRALIPVLAGVPALATQLIDAVAQELRSDWSLPALPPESLAVVVRAFYDADDSEALGVLEDHLSSLDAAGIEAVLAAVTRHGGPETVRRVLQAIGGGDLGLATATLAALPPEQRADLITSFRASARTPEVFALGSRLWKEGATDEARLALAGRLFLPIEEAGDPVALAVAELLHHTSYGHGWTAGYPVDPDVVAELVDRGQLDEGGTCLLVLRWNLFAQRNQIVFTPAQARHWQPSATRVDYRELGALGGINAHDQQLTFRSADGDLPFRGWQLSSPEEAAVVRDLFRAIRRIVRHFEPSPLPPPPSPLPRLGRVAEQAPWRHPGLRGR
ncbi:caspase family protein [Actinoplanes sp. NPDC049596]|uniref:caspase, EACC1-associated type n=1 Tax=unclassified Actinoplanes TaxID=2626549 RepID=UPI00341AA85F